MNKFDLIWIGTGQATGTVIPALNAAGKKVAVIEKGAFGGSCLNYGCTPTKTLVASARVVHMVKRASEFGINVASYQVDFPRVMERMDSMRQKGSVGMESWISKMENVTVFEGVASFIDEHHIQVGEHTLESRDIVVHTGTKPRILPISGLDSVDYLTNKSLLNLKELPAHLVIIGGSYIGMEFGQIFKRLGSEVTILEAAPRIMMREDEDVVSHTKKFLIGEGIKIHEGINIEKIEKTASGIKVLLKDVPQTVEGSHLLVAVGRVPATRDLHLENAGVATDEKGFVTVDDTLHTSQLHIYAVGDVNGKGAFTHTSVNDGEIFLDHYLGKGNRKISDRIITYAMYTDPPLGRVGMSEAEARKSGKKVLMATRSMKNISRAREKNEMNGMIKILVDADSLKFLGVTILGVGGDEIISMFNPLIMAGVTTTQLRKTVLPHPTVAELMPWILDDLAPLQ